MKNSPAVLTRWFDDERVSVASEFAAWLDSDDGRKALSDAANRAGETADRLDEARKVTPEQLHAPVTL